MKKNHFSSFFCIASSEEEERGTVPFKTVPFGPLFFFMHETASFWIKRAVSIKNGARKRQISNQPSIIFCFFFNCAPANFGLCPSWWPRFSL
jgi:hypothetical protein